MHKTDLFNIKKPDKINKSFEEISKRLLHEPTRIMMDEIYCKMFDVDGNFVEQIQTTGFDARIFELFLFAYFESCGYKIIRDYDCPDFIVECDGLKVAIEATTVNKSDKFESKDYLKMNDEERLKYILNEVPIRLGSALYSKLNHEYKVKGKGKFKYWELDQCKDIPFVLAVEAFFDENSLGFSSSSLTNYLYGEFEYPTHTVDGKLDVKSIPLKEHKLMDKQIPSNFFKQPNTENISAIIFSNTGTIAKFKRMGYQEEYYSSFMKITREGTCYDFNPNASKPLQFIYDLDNPPIRETWGQGLVVCYNPNAKIPLTKDFFDGTVQTYCEDNKIYTDIPRPFYPFTSKTQVLGYGEYLFEINESVERITKRYFSDLVGIDDRDMNGNIEIGWVATKNKDRLATLIMNIDKEKYGYAIFNKEGSSYEPYKFIKAQFELKEAAQFMLDDIKSTF